MVPEGFQAPREKHDDDMNLTSFQQNATPSIIDSPSTVPFRFLNPHPPFPTRGRHRAEPRTGPKTCESWSSRPGTAEANFLFYPVFFFFAFADGWECVYRFPGGLTKPPPTPPPILITTTQQSFGVR